MPVRPLYLCNNHRRILEALRSTPRLSTIELSQQLGYTRATIRQSMTELRRMGYRIRCESAFTLVKEPE